MTRIVAALLVCVAAAGGAYGGLLPKRIALPDGFQPEGIATTGTTFYVGSIPTGAVYRGSLLTGRGSVLVPGREGRAATGLDVAHGQIFVAGAGTGSAFVYDARTGADIATFELATTSDTFVNDVVVTKHAAFFTDSRQPVLYRVELGADGRATPQSTVSRIALTGDLQYQAGFNVNGIDATAGGKTLVLVQSNTGLLFTADPETGMTRRIDLGTESVPNGDGILLSGLRLYVVQNRLNVVAKIALQPGLAAGRVLRRITGPQLDVPTTIDRFGLWLYAVNARFGTTPTADTEYWVTRLPW
jgi:outer membrane protein assembly factor BamB